MQHHQKTEFEKYLEERLKHLSKETKQLAIQQLDELFELVARIFTKEPDFEISQSKVQ